MNAPKIPPRSSLAWGLPDWRNAEEYPHSAKECDWSIHRWRWEFLRRSDRYRAVYFRCLGVEKSAGGMVALNQPFQEFDLIGLPDPRVSEPPTVSGDANNDRLILPISERLFGREYIKGRGERGQIESIQTRAGEHDYLIGFSLHRPLNEQIKEAKRFLLSIQRVRFGKIIQFRKVERLWPTYLRVSDAHDAGASNEEIVGVLKLGGSPGADPVARVRDTLNASRDLGANFRH